MTDSPENPPALPSRRTLVKASIALASFAVLIALAALYDYNTAKQFSGLRFECLFALIVAGIGATSCLAGLIHILDLPAASAPRFLRFSLNELKRPLLALQFLTGSAALASAGILIFHLNIPGPEFTPSQEHSAARPAVPPALPYVPPATTYPASTPATRNATLPSPTPATRQSSTTLP